MPDCGLFTCRMEVMTYVKFKTGFPAKPPAQSRKTPVKDRIIDLGISLSANLNLDDLLNMIIKEASSIFNAEGASILLLDEKSEALQFKNVVGLEEQKILEKMSLKKGEGIAGFVASEGRPLIISDVQKDPRFSRKADIMTGMKTRNMMAVPLKSKDRILGTMEVINKMEGDFTRKELAACQTLGSFASVAIENARLHGELTQNLRTITRLEDSKHELIRLLSHELRTPVTVIWTSSTLLCDHLGDMNDVMIRETTEMISTRSLRLASLIDDLFVINDIDEIRDHLVMERIPLREVLELCVVRARKLMKDHCIDITIIGEKALPRFNADRMKLQHCIYHLVENAIKFSPRGGTIHIRVYLDKNRSSFLNIEVEDPGIGIAACHREKVFEKFYQVDSSTTRQFGGLGLGLFICKRVAEVHGGDLKCLSVPGQGSTFILSMPVSGRRDEISGPGK
jgi:signal transduction histidine kinase